MQKMIRNALTAWLLSVLAPGIWGAVVFVVSFVALWFLRRPRLERWFLVGAACTGGWFVACSFTWGFLGAWLVLLLLCVVYGLRGWDGSRERHGSFRGSRTAVTIFAVVFFLFLGLWTGLRVWAYRTPTYDFGLFAQMFHQMRTTGLPMTTLERDGLLSHFAVHVSPIYYLMLPLYCLFPYPVTLQLAQAAVMASAVLPLWKLCKAHGVSGSFCLLLLLYPAFIGGASYDLHENCFLTPLLFWLFYAAERKDKLWTAVFTILTLMVKEDAAVYVAVFGLYLLFRDARRGVTLLTASVVWFLAVTFYLSNYGDGVMSGRYSNVADSLPGVILFVLRCPWKALSECFEAEKLEYLGLTMAPLLGLPLMTRRYERFLLLIPFFLVNLLSDYQYQHSIYFQYNFGSLAFLFYLSLLNLSELRWTILPALAVSVVLFCLHPGEKGVKEIRSSLRSVTAVQEIQAALEQIPQDAPVAASSFFTTALSKRELLYDVHYTKHLDEVEYLVLQPGTDCDTGGFSCIYEGSTIHIYQASK